VLLAIDLQQVFCMFLFGDQFEYDLSSRWWESDKFGESAGGWRRFSKGARSKRTLAGDHFFFLWFFNIIILPYRQAFVCGSLRDCRWSGSLPNESAIVEHYFLSYS
jgi:hypothetical protein